MTVCRPGIECFAHNLSDLVIWIIDHDLALLVLLFLFVFLFFCFTVFEIVGVLK